MSYRYTGDTHRRLRESYLADTAPHPTNTSMDFPPQEHGRTEVRLLKRLFFPRCWNAQPLVRSDDAVLDELERLGQTLYTGIRPYSGEEPTGTVDRVLDRLPAIRKSLKTDLEAAYKGDPAAKSYLEVIRSYPGFHSATIHRVAHELYEAGEPEYARELSEHSKTVTGIDVHPGVDVGEYLFIDHGTGVVIGETATLGEWVRIYQGVTLGALHFEESEDDEKSLAKGYKRHPDIGDNVVIGAGTKVLGPIEVGDHVSIGANSWVTEDVPDHTAVYISEHPAQERKHSE